MSYFAVDPEQQLADAEEKLQIAIRIAESALEAYGTSPTRENRIALQAAERLVKETLAERAEWTRT